MALGWRKDYARYKGFFLNIVDFYKQKKDLLMFLEILLSMATIAIFSVFAIKPTAITIIELMKEIKSKEEELARMDNKLADLKNAQANYSKEAERIQLLDTAVPLNPAPVTFFRQIQGISSNDSANLESASIDEVVLVGDVKVKKSKGEQESLPSGAEGISFYFDFKANFSALQSILSDLEYLRRPIRIDTLKISKQKIEDLTTDILDFTISGQAPYFREGDTQK